MKCLEAKANHNLEHIPPFMHAITPVPPTPPPPLPFGLIFDQLGLVPRQARPPSFPHGCCRPLANRPSSIPLPNTNRDLGPLAAIACTSTANAARRPLRTLLVRCPPRTIAGQPCAD